MDDAKSSGASLDPVVVEALWSITESVCHRSWDSKLHRSRYVGMLDKHSRDCVIAAFKHLKHADLAFPPHLVRRWAIANGWKDVDAQILDDYGAGVLAGVRYHHSDPFGFHAIGHWRTDAEGKEPWRDPGRPTPPGYVPLQRRD
jgi:hypothetical protein